MKQGYRCWAEIDLGALSENLAWIRARVGPGVKIMTVVKADAYGHGLKQIAAHLMQSGTDVFGVANLVEARGVRGVGKGWPILMLGACLPDEVETAVRDEVMPTLSSLEEAKWFSAAALKHRKTVAVQLKVDTGMGRLGVEPGEAVELLLQIRQLPGLRLEGLYTHFADVEDDAAFSRAQMAAFQGVLARLDKQGVQIPCVHAGNSGALLYETAAAFNLVRPGLLVYGILPQGKRSLAPDLRRHFRPALSFKCRVSLVKDVPRGKTLSYGHAYEAPRRLRVATLTAGYGDGYLRAASHRAHVLVHGRRCPILGRITMDQMLADISEVPHTKPGDEVVLIGRQGDAEISAAELALWLDTIPWEVFTNITYRVPRLYHGGHAA